MHQQGDRPSELTCISNRNMSIGEYIELMWYMASHAFQPFFGDFYQFSLFLISFNCKVMQSYNGNKKISFPYFPFKKKLKSSQNGNAEALLLELELESSDFLISLSSAKRPLSVSFPFSTLLNCFSQRNIEQIGTDCDLFTKEFEMKTFSSPKQTLDPVHH